MAITPETTLPPVRPAPRELSPTIRLRTRDLAHLRARVVRLKRQPGLADSPLDAALEEAVSLCTALLQELSGAEMEIQRGAADARAERQQADDLFDQMLMPCVCADDN